VHAKYLSGSTDERPNPSLQIPSLCDKYQAWDLPDMNTNLTMTFGVLDFPSGHIIKCFPIKILYAFPDSTPEQSRQMLCECTHCAVVGNAICPEV
jgi:hypothetical protein